MDECHPERLSNSILQYFQVIQYIGVEIVFPRIWQGIARDPFQLVQGDKVLLN